MTENPLLVALALVFIAELGDKTQLIALAFATRHRMTTVLTAAAIGTVLVTAVSAGLGATLGQFIAEHWLKIITGILLIVFALLIVKGDSDEDEEAREGLTRKLGPIAGIAVTFFLAEIGDKTMIATIGLAAQTDHVVMVWAGATLGMIGANIIGIAVGRLAGKKLPEKLIRWVAATIFFASGVLILIDGLRMM